MKPEEYAGYDALGLAELVSQGEISASELLDAALAATGAVNGEINAVVELFEDVHPSVKSGTFQGVPFLIKDIVVMAEGRRSEMGSRLFEGFVAPLNSALMERIDRAGFTTFGRTATPELAFNVSTEARLYGATRNPWNPEYMPGGSSGGAAAAVAAGIVPMAHATDGGGSIRLPASCCGTFGLKPSRGRVSAAPVDASPVNGLGYELAVSRTVRDTAAFLDAVQGPEPGDPFEIAPPETSYLAAITKPPKRLRIGIHSHSWSGAPIDGACLAAVSDAGRLCENLGYDVEEKKLPLEYGAYLNALLTVWSSNITHGVTSGANLTGRPINLDTLEATTVACYEHGRSLNAEDLLDALATFNTLSRHMAHAFRDFDMVLMPTCMRLPQLLGTYDANDSTLSAMGWIEHIFGFAAFTAIWNITGQPAMSVPLMWSPSGLPVGVQFVARLGEEAKLLALAAQLETARPWRDKFPPLSARRDSIA